MRGRCCAALLLAAWPALPQQRQPDPGTGAIEGTAVNAATSRPLRKVTVTLRGAGLQGLPTALSVATDGIGHFAFRGLLAGSYRLEAKRDGYTSESRDATLDPGERKTLDIALGPLGSISGRVVDEEGAPVSGCNAQALQPIFDGGRRRLLPRGAATTGQDGEYRIGDLGRGRYYVVVWCRSELVAPHPLMLVDDPRRQSLRFPRQFYPGVPGLDGASRVAVTPGAEVRGIDVRMRRVLGVTLTGVVGAADPSTLQRPIQVDLLPAGSDLIGAMAGGPFLRPDGKFQFPVTPGSYLLVARAWDQSPTPAYTAQLPVEITSEPPAPVQLVLARCPDTAGTLEVEGDNAPPTESFQVLVHPIDSPFGPQELRAQVTKDGAFTLVGLVAGRWRLNISGPDSYVKSLTIGESAVSPYGFEVPQGGAGALRIVVSTKTGQLRAAVAGGEQARVTLLLVPADLALLGSGLDRTIAEAGNAAVTFKGVPPGRYLLFALETANAWELLQQPAALKALETRAEAVEVGEGETVQAALDVIDTAQIQEALEKAE